MADQCAADVVHGHRRCTKRGRYPAQVQPTTTIPAPADEQVCHWHQADTVPARRYGPGYCECCGQKLP